MATIKSYTDLDQSKKLAEILPIESADMYYSWIGTAYLLHAESYNEIIAWRKEYAKTHNNPSFCTSIIPCWSLAALLGVLPEINGIPLTLEKVKAEDGYEGYYYHIEYKDKILIPYSKNPIDACVDMILKLNELKML